MAVGCSAMFAVMLVLFSSVAACIVGACFGVCYCSGVYCCVNNTIFIHKLKRLISASEIHFLVY